MYDREGWLEKSHEFAVGQLDSCAAPPSQRDICTKLCAQLKCLGVSDVLW